MTVTTTKTIIREHETNLVVREARTVAADVVVLSLADPQGAELPAVDARCSHRSDSGR